MILKTKLFENTQQIITMIELGESPVYTFSKINLDLFLQSYLATIKHLYKLKLYIHCSFIAATTQIKFMYLGVEFCLVR